MRGCYPYSFLKIDNSVHASLFGKYTNPVSNRLKRAAKFSRRYDTLKYTRPPLRTAAVFGLIILTTRHTPR